MAACIRAHDWAATPLGPIAGWPQPLRTGVELMLGSPQVAAVAWGPELSLLYNDAAVDLLGDSHPWALAQPFRALWPLPETGELIDATLAGATQRLIDRPYVIPARPHWPNAWFTGSWTPLRDEGGQVRGIYIAGFETTELVLAERELRATAARQAFLLKIADALRLLDGADTVVTTACRLLTEYLGANRAEYVEIEDEGGVEVAVLRAGYPDMPGPAAGRNPLGGLAGGAAAVLRQGGTVMQRGGQGDAEGLASLAVPVIKGGRLAACLVLRDAAPRGWTADEAGLARTVAERIWITVERARVKEALRAGEERYRTLSELVPVLLWQTDPSGNAVSINAGWLDYTGQTLQQAQNGGWLDAIHPDDRERSARAFAAAHASQQPLRIEHRIRRRDGAYCWHQIHYRPSLDAQGTVTAWFGAAIDIDDQRRTMDRLRESEARIATMVESLPVGVGVVDLWGRIILSNSELRRFLPGGIMPSRDPMQRRRWRAERLDGTPLLPDDWPGARALRGERVMPGVEMVHTADDGRETWTNVSTAPIPGDDGAVTAFVAVVSDIDASKRIAEALRESEEMMRRFGEASHDVLWVRDARTLQLQYLTPAFEATYGIDREQALAEDDFRGWLDLVLPEDRPKAVENTERLRAGERVTFDFRIRRPSDGAIRWLRNTDFPIADRDGNITRLGGISHDATELREAELRLQTLMTGIPQLVWRAVNGGQWTWSSPQWAEYTGQSPAESQGLGWLAALHPDDGETAMRLWKEAARTGRLEMEGRIFHMADQDWRWFQTRATPVRDSDGTIIEWLGTSTDIHDLRELQESQKVLVAELQHRTRNLMAVVRSLAERTALSSEGLADFRDRFRDRLDALARVQGLLSRLEEHDRVTFGELIRTELSALGAAFDRVTLQGPEGVRLRSSTVQMLALALHELATNAVKYGALGQPQGRLAVIWTFSPGDEGGDPWLHIDWLESGVAMPAAGPAPHGSGQGRELIERALPYQLGARTRFVLGPDGLNCTISLPVSASMAGRR